VRIRHTQIHRYSLKMCFAHFFDENSDSTCGHSAGQNTEHQSHVHSRVITQFPPSHTSIHVRRYNHWR